MDKNAMMKSLARESYEKGGMLSLAFGAGCMMYKGFTCKKL